MSECVNVKWRDNYRIIGFLFPQLFKLKDRFGNPFRIPFDPHDIKYYDMDIYEGLDLKNLPDGVRIDWVKEFDLTFDEEGNERIRKVKLCYFQTRTDFVLATTENYTALVEGGISV